jgi:acyl carrier protein
MAPRNPIEETLVRIMAEVLKVKRIGIHDDFFELGGHSLLGIQVMARVRKALQVELPLRSLFQEPTVAGLALAIEKAEKCGDGLGLPSPTREISNRVQLLARLADLSDTEVNTLLSSMLAKRQDERETEDF